MPDVIEESFALVGRCVDRIGAISDPSAWLAERGLSPAVVLAASQVCGGDLAAMAELDPGSEEAERLARYVFGFMLGWLARDLREA